MRGTYSKESRQFQEKRKNGQALHTNIRYTFMYLISLCSFEKTKKGILYQGIEAERERKKLKNNIRLSE